MQPFLANQIYNNRNSFGKNYLKHREAIELSFQEFTELKAFCDFNKILFFATPFDEESLEELASLNCELFKVASADIVHTELLRKIAEKGKPIILSTGGATIEEAIAEVKLPTFTHPHQETPKGLTTCLPVTGDEGCGGAPGAVARWRSF